MIVLNEQGTPAVNTIHNCDALKLLGNIVSSSVDLVVTSPPYNLRNSTGNGLKSKNDKGLWSNSAMNNGYDTFTDDLPHEIYVAQQRALLDECMRILKPSGAIFYNHNWRVQNGLLQDRSDILAGFPVRQIIIWDRGTGFNFNDGYLLPMYEVIYLIAKPDFKLIKVGNAWGNVWRIPPAENKAHPNAFPLEIPRRCIEISGARLVVDPYGGIGTTAKAAQVMGCDFITCDISAKYCETARRELAHGYTLPLFAHASA